ncbi:MAG: tetratricopeptide repeat protein, partial [Gemmataceae bacterium]
VKAQEERKRRRVQMTLGAVLVVMLLGVGGAAFWYQDAVNRQATTEKQLVIEQREKQLANERLKNEQKEKQLVERQLENEQKEKELANQQLKSEQLARRLEQKQKEFANQQDANQLDAFLTKFRKIHDEFDKTLKKNDGQGVFELQNRRQEWTDKLASAIETISGRGEKLLGRIEDERGEEFRQRLDGLRQLLVEDQREWNIAAELGYIRERRMTWIEAQFDDKYALDNYPKSFKKTGLDLFNGDPEVAARRLRSMRIHRQAVASLYDWAWVASNNRKLPGRLLKVAALVEGEPDVPALKLLQDAKQWSKLWSDQDALKELIDSLPADVSPSHISLVGNLTKQNSAAEKAWLDLASSRYPHDFLITFYIASRLGKSASREALGYFRAAVNINPTSAATFNSWGLALAYLKKYNEAIEKFKIATKIDENDAMAYYNWGLALDSLKKYDEAIAKFQKAIKIEPNDAKAYNNWGLALYSLKKYDEAIEKFKNEIKIEPNDAYAYYIWGLALDSLKKYDEAIVKYKSATKIEPNDADAYYNWGLALYSLKKYDEAITKFQKAIKIEPNDADAYYNWGLALAYLKKYDEAIVKYKSATKIEPNDADAYYNWGLALSDLKKYDEAIEKYKIVTKIEPNDADAYTSWGLALSSLKKYDEAIAKFQKAIKIEPNDADAYYSWGLALDSLKKYDEAIVPLEKAIKLQPRYPNPRILLGLVHYQQGSFREAIAAFQGAKRILPQRYPWNRLAQTKIAECQLWLDREKKLPAFLASAQNVSVQEHLAMVTLCVRYKKRYRDAVKLCADLFQREPKLANNLKEQHRYNAACVATLAASGKGAHAKKIDAQERTRLRQQAHQWLQADLTVSQAALQKNRFFASTIVDRMQHWKTDSDLTTVRDKKLLAKLPKDEQQPWQKLWSDVQVLEKSARSHFSETKFSGKLQRDEISHPLKMKAGHTYIIKMQSQQFDTFLRLHDSNGKKLDENDDIVNGKIQNSRIQYTPKTNGTYRIVATSFQGRGRGQYEIMIREFPKPPRD